MHSLIAKKILKLETLFVIVGFVVKLMEHKRKLDAAKQAPQIVDADKK